MGTHICLCLGPVYMKVWQEDQRTSVARVTTEGHSRIRAFVRVELVSHLYFSVCLFFQIGDLKPDTSYVFLVRAENSHGLSVPSPISEVARTLGSDRRSVPQYELDEARVRLGTKVVELRDVQPISSTSVRLLWDVSCLQRFMIQWSRYMWKIVCISIFCPGTFSHNHEGQLCGLQRSIKYAEHRFNSQIFWLAPLRQEVTVMHDRVRYTRCTAKLFYECITICPLNIKPPAQYSALFKAVVLNRSSVTC